MYEMRRHRVHYIRRQGMPVAECGRSIRKCVRWTFDEQKVTCRACLNEMERGKHDPAYGVETGGR